MQLFQIMIMRYKFEQAVDLTHDLVNGMPVYPGDPAPSFESYSTIEKNGVNLTRLVLGSHTGTHVDAPFHFVLGGIPLDKVPVTKFVGEAFVVDLSKLPVGSGITEQDLAPALEGKVQPNDIVICYTGCSKLWEDEKVWRNFTYLTASGANYLVSKKVSVVGIDFMSVEKFGATEPIAHRTLLKNGICIVESLNAGLEQFAGRRILLVCLPIKLKGGDGSPARAMAVPIENS